MAAYTKPQHRKNKESERLRGEIDKIKFIDLRFERWQLVGLSALCWTGLCREDREQILEHHPRHGSSTLKKDGFGNCI